VGGTIRTRVKGGFFEHLEKTDLPEGKEVIIAVVRVAEDSDDEAFLQSAGSWKGGRANQIVRRVNCLPARAGIMQSPKRLTRIPQRPLGVVAYSRLFPFSCSAGIEGKHRADFSGSDSHFWGFIRACDHLQCPSNRGRESKDIWLGRTPSCWHYSRLGTRNAVLLGDGIGDYSVDAADHDDSY